MSKKPILTKKQQRAAKQQDLPVSPEPVPVPAPVPPAPAPRADPVDGELCSGCGAVAPTHPMAGVARDQETGLMTEFPVCQACWLDPAHRQHTLKMHFFSRDQAAVAVDAAERNILAEPPP